MIQVYSKNNTNFSNNGDMVLLPDDAITHVVLNGAWNLELHHPIDERGRWKYLTEEAVLKVPSFNGEQLFRIYNVEKSDGGVSVQAFPIFFDAKNDCFLMDIRAKVKNGQQALDIILAPNNKYSAESNITKVSSAYYEYENAIQAICGDASSSFLNRWGGEILFDNHKIIINERVGGDYGVELRYGKNIKANGIREEIDLTEVVTRLYPKAFNGRKLSNSGYVDSSNIGKYSVVKCETMKFEHIKLAEDLEGDPDDTDIICNTQAELDKALTDACNEQFALGLDKPIVTIEADMVLLQNTEEYKDYQILETVSLGDTIHCKHDKLGIVTDARVIELEYDCLLERVSSVKLGDFKKNYFDDVTENVHKIESVIRPDGTLMADKVAGIINAMNAQLKYQKDVAQKHDVRAMLFEDLDQTSPTYGAMCYGTQGLQIADKRTADGRDWDWSTAITAKGAIADHIIAGVLSDKTGKNYWNFDTGEIRLERLDLKIESQDESLGALSSRFDKEVGGLVTEISRVDKASQEGLNSANKEISTINTKLVNTVTPDELKLEFIKERQKGATKVTTNTGFVFNDNGLTVDKVGASTKTQINENGMKVFEGNNAVLTADNQGVNARNLHATTYLIVGNNSRFEDYQGNRTACFFIG